MTKYLLACLFALVFAASAHAGGNISYCTNWIGTQSGTHTDMASGAGMSPGDCMYDEANGGPIHVYLIFQGDGNLVMYQYMPSYAADNGLPPGDYDTALWATGTQGTGANYAVMWASGNFTVYSSGWTQRWTAALWSGWQTPVSGSLLRVYAFWYSGCGHLCVMKPDGSLNWAAGY